MGEVAAQINRDALWEQILGTWTQHFPVEQVEVPMLSHYTTAEGLLGICQSNKLWATCAQYSNDASEGKYAQGLTLEAFHQFFDHRELTEDGRTLRLHLERTLSPGSFQEDVYVTAFCESSDLLSQWRAYGKDAGFEIRFGSLTQPNALLRGAQVLSLSAASLYKKSLQKVEYSRDEQLRIVLDILERCYRVLTAVEERGRFADVAAILATFCLLELTRWQCRTKHPSFREEEEWRIVAFPKLRILLGGIEYEDFSPLRYRPGRHSVIPYIELAPPDQEKLPIREIICGPGGHNVLTAKAVELLLRTCGFRDVNVRNSEVPLAR